ncbi:hypothetical protein [Mariniblastus fucicola]|uniref:Uncharacterized protein n=1 Tax=Mariniblastus fucicola TaxID=980251 RepID=A0A5B9P9U0_9BACT|nr:hypothetical protein [Mariniblastus fucicola]QEG22015.1 hypothetical protein MFFC18_18760 [Mariniblastus fucicola]
MHNLKRLALPIFIAAIAYGMLFGIVDIFLTGGFALDLGGLGMLLIALPAVGALMSVFLFSCFVTLGALLRVTPARANTNKTAEIALGSFSMLPAWMASYVLMGLENGFSFTPLHHSITLVTALAIGTISVAIANSVKERGITMR